MRTPLAWRALHAAGLIGLYSRVRQRRTLTVVTFERVLPAGDVRWFGVDPARAIPAELFRECLAYFARHYQVVGLDRLFDARAGRAVLPDRALHLTLDGGWVDTAEVALPILQEARLPATVFVASEAVGAREPFWEDQLFAAWSEGRLSPPEADRLWREVERDAAPPPPSWGVMEAPRQLVARLGGLEQDEREALLGSRRALLDSGGLPTRLSPADLERLRAAGIRIGSQGRSGRALARVSDPEEELRASRRALAELGCDAEQGGPQAFAFPRGAHTPELEELALSCGYTLLFAGAAPITRSTPNGIPARLGRLAIDPRELVDASARFRPALMARALSR